MEALTVALRSAVPDSPAFDSALVALVSAARAEGLRGSEVLAVVGEALRGSPLPPSVLGLGLG